jgi:IS30 family transposase
LVDRILKKITLVRLAAILNGRVRRCPHKGSDLRLISDVQLALVVKRLNNLSGECLNYRAQHEVFFDVLSSAFEN